MRFHFFKLITLSFLITSNLLAQEVTYERKLDANVRNKRFKLKEKEVTLKYLLSPNTFDGKYFKIVLGKSEDAIRLSEKNKMLKLRAATVYYHLNTARDYFSNVLKSEHVKSLSKITIRLNLTNKFNRLGKFANDNLDPQFNNAVTIPAGRGMPDRGVPSWETEIWFRSPKKVKPPQGEGSFDSVEALLNQYRKQSRETSIQKFLVTLLQKNNWENPENLGLSTLRIVGSAAILEASYYVAKGFKKLFRPRTFFLDAAMVPEIITHEYAHVALSDHLALYNSTPVNEGLADYFAAVIANSPKLAKKIRKYSKAQGKDGNRRQIYNSSFERNDFANIDYVLGILWGLRKMFPKKADLMIFEMRNSLTSGALIRKELVSALLSACDIHCNFVFSDKLRLKRFLHDRGL